MGPAVDNVAVGDTVIVHPLITCGFCRACRAGDDMHCTNSAFPGINTDGGFATFLKTGARAVVKLDPSLAPKDVAALADAGLTAYHAVKKAAAILYPGTRTVVIGCYPPALRLVYYSDVRERGAHRLADVARGQMRVVPFGHSRIRMS